MNIGATIVIKGDVTSAEDLVIAGRVEGNIHLHAGALMLAPGSHVAGEIAVPSVVVHGTVNGKVAATDRIDVRPTAEMRGSLAAPKLVVAEGAQLNAKVEMPAIPKPHLVQSAPTTNMSAA